MTANTLKNLELFQSVSPQTVEEIWNRGTINEFTRGTIVIEAWTPFQNVCIQLTGKSIIYNLTHHGRRKIIFIYGTGALLNEHICTAHNPSLFCETIEKSKIFTICIRDFLQLMEQDFSLTRAIMEVQERKLWRLEHQLKNTLGNIYLERKLAAKLWKLGRDFGIQTETGLEIDIQLPISLLADMLGAPRETVSRACSTLVRQGLIQIEKKRIKIPDPDRMAHFYKNEL